MVTTDKDFENKHYGPLIATCVGIVFIVGGFAIWQARPLYRWVQAQRALQQVDDIYDFLDRERFVEAHELAFETYRLAPREPEVLRACSRVAMTMRSPEARYFFEQLIEQGEATYEDRRNLLRTNLHLGDNERARALSDELLRERPTDVELLKLVVAMKMSEEKTRDAMAFLSRVIEIEPEDTEHRLLLARLLILHGTAEERQRGWEFMWGVAHSTDQYGLGAIETLLSAEGLSKKAYPKLIELIENHPLAEDPHLVAAVGLKSSLDPASRASLISEAVAQRRDYELARQVPLYQWLNREGEYATILENLTFERARADKDMLVFYLNALGHQNHWDKVRDILADPTLPLSEARQLMFSALCAQKLGEDETVVEGFLQRSLQTATRHGSFTEAFNTGSYAEAAGLDDLAELAYGLAQRSPATTERSFLALQRIARKQGDAIKLREVTARMHYRYPRRSELHEDFLYLNALVGMEVESTLDKSLSMVEAEPFRAMPRVIAGLAYYRMSDFSNAAETTASCDSTEMTASQKAVCAALAAATNRPEEARRLVADIPAENLLREEQRLLKVF